MNVYRAGSYGNAANVLNMSQPTISNHISSLEQQLGKTLFRKDQSLGKRYKPTKAANDLARELSPHIDRIEEIYISTRGHPKKAQGTVHIGGLTEFVETHVTHTISALMPENIRFIIQYDSPDQWIEMLEEQTLDMAILPMPINASMIDFKELIADQLVMVAHTDFIKAGAKLDYLLDLPYIAYAPEFPCIKQFIAGLPISRSDLRVFTTTSSFRMIKDMLLSKSGFSIVPRSFVEDKIKSGEIFVANTDKDLINMRLYLAWNKLSMQKPKNIFVRDAILDSLYS
ncbi:MAG: LysR family transcriptional regulator [Pseudomonadota bacterium]